MGKRNDAPTRSEVVETIEDHKEDMSELAEELDITSIDVETVRDTLESLDFEGTTEGIDEVENAIEQAEDVTIDIFEQQDENLEEIQDRTEEYEGQLESRSDSSESDKDKISGAVSKIETKETVDELENAKKAISSDIEFLNEQNDISRQAREEIDRLQEEYWDRVKNGRK